MEKNYINIQYNNVLEFFKKNIIISTDDKEIIKCCKKIDLSFIKRTKYLSKGNITSMQILSDVKKKIKTNSENYIYLQVTTP